MRNLYSFKDFGSVMKHKKRRSAENEMVFGLYGETFLCFVASNLNLYRKY